MAAISYDALIIGSGQAGNPLAVALANAGRRVALIEQGELGGSCLNYGCSPTKTLLATAQRLHDLRTAPAVAAPAVPGATALTVDLAAAVARKDALTAKLRAGVRANLTEAQVDIVPGHAVFVGPHVLRVTADSGAAQDYTAPLIFINTGTRPAIPDVPGLGETGFLTTDELLHLTELPEHLLILGGGYIGLEFGQMFRRFGSRVTILETGRQLLDHEDADVSEALQTALAAEGVDIVLGAQAHRVSRAANGEILLAAHTPAGERRLRGSHLLVATGRRPNSDKLGLGFAGIKTDDDGYIQVNGNLQTNVRGVYALGDVHGGPQFTHISYDDYRIVRDALLHGCRRSARQRPLPYCVFTEPQLGRIGLSEAQAKAQQIPYRVAKMPVASIGRAQETGAAAGFWKILVGADDRILGAALVGAAAGDIMAVVQVAMAGRLRYPQLREMIFAHPTWAEGLNNVFAKLAD